MINLSTSDYQALALSPAICPTAKLIWLAHKSAKELMQKSTRFLIGKVISVRPNGDMVAGSVWISEKRGVFRAIDAMNITHITSENHYIRIYVYKKDSYLIKSSLKDFYQDQLSKYDIFFPLSRSIIVNLEMVLKVESNQLFLKDQTILRIPKNKRDELLELLGVFKY
jgi:DNA-binding LytR/AlgR family response regulator